jgi:hypothetical protein
MIVHRRSGKTGLNEEIMSAETIVKSRKVTVLAELSPSPAFYLAWCHFL